MDARREELTTRYLDLAPNLTTLEITQTVDTFLKRHKNGCDNDTADRYLVDAILQQGAQKEAHGDVHMAQPTERAQQCSRSPIAAFIDSVIDGIVRRGDRGDNTNPAQPPAEDPVEPEVAGAEVEVPEEAAPTVHIDPMAVDMDMAGAQEEVAEETVEAQVEAVEEVVEVVEQARPPAPTLDLSEAQDMLAGISSPTPTTIVVTGKSGSGKTSVINAMINAPLLPMKLSSMEYTMQAALSLSYTLTATDVLGEEQNASVELDGLPVFQQSQLMAASVAKFANTEHFPSRQLHITGPMLLPKNLILKESSQVDITDTKVIILLINDMSDEELAPFKASNGNVVFARITTGVDKGAEVAAVPEGLDVVDIDPKHFLSVSIATAFSADQELYAGTFDVFKRKVHDAIGVAKRNRTKATQETADVVLKAAETMKAQWEEVLQHAAGLASHELSRPPLSSESAVVSDAVVSQASSSSSVVATSSSASSPVLANRDYVPTPSSYQPAAPYTPNPEVYTPAVSTWQPGQ